VKYYNWRVNNVSILEIYWLGTGFGQFVGADFSTVHGSD
jgi:hypothetical protein